MVSPSHLYQGVNLLLLEEVFFCSLLSLLLALSSPTYYKFLKEQTVEFDVGFLP